MNKKFDEQEIERNCYTCKNYSLNKYSRSRSCCKDFKDIQKNFHDCCEDYVLNKEVKERYELVRQVKEIVIPDLPYEIALLEKIADTWDNWGREKAAGLYDAELDKALKKGDYRIGKYLMVPLFGLEFDLAKDWFSANGYESFASRIAGVREFFYKQLSKAEENTDKAYRKKERFKRKTFNQALGDIDYFLADNVTLMTNHLREIIVAIKSKFASQVLVEIPEKAAEIGQKIMPEKYIKLAEQIASNLEDWANPKAKTGLRYEYVGYSKPISIAVEGLDELLEWLHHNQPEHGAFIQLQYDTLMSNAKLDDHLLETLYEDAEVLSEGSAEDLVFALRSIVNMPKGVFVEDPTVMSPEAEFGQGTGTNTDLAKVPTSELIKQGESHTLEFKETLEYDIKTNKNSKDVLLSSLKTIAGFLNADGGTLLIGVDDSGNIKGIERDLSTMKHSNNDKFELRIRNCLKDRFKPQPIGKVSISFEKFTEGTICRVDVQANKEIAHLDGDVYVRDGNTTQKLEGLDLTNWIQRRKT
jgi:uncharacterized FlaG/YvyC family protein